MNYDIIVIGGGAAGFFAAIQAARANSTLKIAILERGNELLTKVKISGGGRCNVTHAEFDPKELTGFYPRGSKELLGPFHSFCSGDTVAFFEEIGIPLKIEEDGRMFPETNTSKTIVDGLQNEAARLGVEVLKGQSVKNLNHGNESWQVYTNKGQFLTKKLLVATGSNSKIWGLLQELGHNIISPVPSLFTFNIKDERIDGLAGLSTYAQVEIMGQKELIADGPLLITHWGLSGPAILKLSAWGARTLNESTYKFEILVNFTPDESKTSIEALFNAMRKDRGKQRIIASPLFDLPKRLWQRLVLFSGIDEVKKWADISKNNRESLINSLIHSQFQVNGKSTFKEEFVTAGGVDLKEINFKTYESKLLPNVFFAGEVINVDAVTGGFNFQNAWTGGFIAGRALASL